MTDPQKTKVQSYLSSLGLSTAETDIFLFLIQSGSSTVLQISRGLSTGRTKLYPLLEELTNKQLVSVEDRHYGTSYEAVSLEVLDFLVTETENKADNLRRSLPAISNILRDLRDDSPTGTRTVKYRGIDGLKQVNYNLTKADGEYRVFELEHLEDYKILPDYFVNKFHQSQMDNNIVSYDLTNNPDWGKHSRFGEDYNKFSKARYIDPSVFNIQFETYIYNDCLTLLNYDPSDIFCLEIYNQNLADQQKQIFDILWKLSTHLR